MSDRVDVPFAKLVPGLDRYIKRVSDPERLALDWYHQPCSQYVHQHLGDKCTSYGWEIWKDTFRAGVSIYTPLYLVTTLMTKRHPIEVIRRALPAMIRSSIFLATYTGLYARLACFLMKIAGNNWRGLFFVSPLISSIIAIYIEKSNRRRELAVYVANQAAEVLFKMALARGFFTYTPFRDGKRFLFALAIGVLHYFYNWSPQDLAPSMQALMRVLAGSKCQKSTADWIERSVRRVTKPILMLRNTSLNNMKDLASQNEGGEPPEKNNQNENAEIASEMDRDEIIEEDDHASNSSAVEVVDPDELDVNPLDPETKVVPLPPSVTSPTLPDTVEAYIASYSTSRFMFWVNGFVRGFCVGYIVKAALSFLPKLFNPKMLIKNWDSIIKKSFGKPAVTFGYFIALVVGLPRMTKMLLTTLYGKQHPLIDIASGMVGGGFASMVQSSTDITLYISSKAAEAIVECLVRHKKIPAIPHFAEMLYSFATAVLFYAAIMEPWTIRPSYRQFLAKASGWHYARFGESDGVRGLRISTGMNELKKQYLKYKKKS